MAAQTRAATLDEGGQHGGGGVDAGHQVGHGHAHLLRFAAGRAVFLAGHAHQPAGGLDGKVVAGIRGVGAVLPIAGDRAVDQARVGRLQARVVQAIFGELADLVVLQQHIGLRSQLAHQRRAFSRGDIDGDGAFAAVGADVVRGHAVGGVAPPRWAPGACVVTDLGALDLDHIGAVVGQQLAAPGAGEHTRQVEDAGAF